jgi:hypothetical protein
MIRGYQKKSASSKTPRIVPRDCLARLAMQGEALLAHLMEEEVGAQKQGFGLPVFSRGNVLFR